MSNIHKSATSKKVSLTEEFDIKSTRQDSIRSTLSSSINSWVGQGEIELSFRIEKVVVRRGRDLTESDLLATNSGSENFIRNEEQLNPIAPTELAAWAYYCMPSEKLDDAVANLEELYSRRILPKICKGNEKKARWIFGSQVVLIFLGHQRNKITAIVAGVAGCIGLPKISDFIKGLL